MKRKKNIIDDISINMSAEMYSKSELRKAIKGLSDINMPGRDGGTLLIYAALFDYNWLIPELLEMGADIEAKDDDGFTPLLAAVNLKNRGCIKTLLAHGADVNAKDSWGNVPLNRADDSDIIELLLKNGADCTIKNNYGNAPIDVYAAYPEIMELFDKYSGKTGDSSLS